MVEGIAELGWLEMLGRLGLAALLGGLLGIEREYDGQDAGFRTHMLVTVGAALFALMSLGGFDQFVAPRNDTNISVDVTRIAAYVAPGIGFIGGGTILKHGGKVSGITTAATLWVAAAIGVASGLGAAVSAVATSVLALLALELLQPISRAVQRRGSRRRSGLFIELDTGADLTEIVAAIGAPVSSVVKQLHFGVGPDDDGQITVEFWRRPDDQSFADLAQRLLALEGVKRVAVGTGP
jgi:putative Mg2+ transporter-C (MgtC) family protein